MNTQLTINGLLLSFLTGCIGSDVVEPSFEKQLSLTPKSLNLLTGETAMLQSMYIDEYGVSHGLVMTEYTNLAETVFIVSDEGLVTALSPGSGKIVAHYNGISSNTTAVRVSGDPGDVAMVEVAAPTQALKLGETLQLTAEVTNFNGDVLPGTAVSWSSDEEDIATVNTTGLVAGISEGMVTITAEADGVSGSLDLIVGESSRMGSFQGSGGYNASGTVTLAMNAEGVLILELSEDFEASLALGTFIYLANSTNGSTVRNSGLELGEHANGPKTYNVTEIAGRNVALFEYRYVIVLCKPASVTFGFADLGE